MTIGVRVLFFASAREVRRTAGRDRSHDVAKGRWMGALATINQHLHVVRSWAQEAGVAEAPMTLEAAEPNHAPVRTSAETVSR